jgi:hypothetical protein
LPLRKRDRRAGKTTILHRFTPVHRPRNRTTLSPVKRRIRFITVTAIRSVHHHVALQYGVEQKR